MTENKFKKILKILEMIFNEEKTVTLKHNDLNEPILEIFLDDDGQIRINELTEKSETEPWEQYSVTEFQAIQIISDNIE